MSRTPSTGLLAWGGVCALLTLGCITTLVEHVSIGTEESRRANEQGQRAVIDPLTGNVALGGKAKEGFDVGAEPAAATQEPATTAPAEETSSPIPDTPAEPAGESHQIESQGETMPDGLTALRTEPLPAKMPTASLRSGDSLVPAPAPEISEKIDGLTLPKRSGERNAATLYARKFKRTPEQHLVSFVILDAGISTQSLPMLLTLPKEVSIAFSPYAANAPERVASLRRAGYEAWGVLPAMGAQYPQDDPGPLGLVTSLPKDELLRRLRQVMADTIGSTGMVLPVGEALSSKPASFTPITAELDARGLALFAATPSSDAAQLAADKKQTPAPLRADMVLDSTMDEATIEANLAKLDALAADKDQLIIVTSARPQSLLILQRWFKEHSFTAPVTLAPLSAQYLPKEAPTPPPAEEEASGGHGGGEKKTEKKPEKKEAKKSDGGHH